jgi:hypothetical protein
VVDDRPTVGGGGGCKRSWLVGEAVTRKTTNEVGVGTGGTWWPMANGGGHTVARSFSLYRKVLMHKYPGLHSFKNFLSY